MHSGRHKTYSTAMSNRKSHPSILLHRPIDINLLNLITIPPPLRPLGRSTCRAVFFTLLTNTFLQLFCHVPSGQPSKSAKRAMNKVVPTSDNVKRMSNTLNHRRWSTSGSGSTIGGRSVLWLKMLSMSGRGVTT